MPLVSNGTIVKDCVEYITNMVNAQVQQHLTGKHPTNLPVSKQAFHINRTFANARAIGLTDFDILQIVLDEISSVRAALAEERHDKEAEIAAKEAAAAKAAEIAQQPPLMVLPSPVRKSKSSKRKVSNGRQ